MDNDDKQVGRILRRREVLALLGAAGGAAFLARGYVFGSGSRAESLVGVQTARAQAAPSCVVKPELTEGPYFVDDQLDRFDIRIEPSDGSISEGVPLALTVNLSQVGGEGCLPLPGAQVDVWHCDARGVYSSVSDNTGNTVGQTFLRGYQVTDAEGAARFLTVYPGWYTGRAVHIHFKVRTTGSDGNAYEFTSQWFFDDALSDQVFTQLPYANKSGRRMLNSSDGIYRAAGDQLLLNVAQVEDGSYATTFDLGLDLSDTAVGRADGGLGGPGGRPPRP